MLIALFGFFLLLGIVGVVLYNYTSLDESAMWCAASGFLLSIVIAIIGFITLAQFISAQTLDKSIEMYEQENVKLEATVSKVVESYMAYEVETYKSLSLKGMETTDIVALVSLFPNLSSDALVKSQIETIVANNSKIKQLKESRIASKPYGWWLYFAPLN